MLKIIKKILPIKLINLINERVVKNGIRHVYGVAKVRLSPEEAAVTCLVKNGEYYIEQFIEHYSKMGFRHIFFLDNGSIDNTISLIKQYKNTSIYKTELPVKKYQPLLKKILSQKTVHGGWCLDVDIDEFFDYAYSDKVGLDSFLKYLNLNKYNTVVTQMLDMFSDRSLSGLSKQQKENLKNTYRYYDISDIEKVPYCSSELVKKFGSSNVLVNDSIELYFGGIRKNLYNLNCLLSKHSLFSRRVDVNLFTHVHFVDKANLADISCLLLHYKLTSNALEIAYQNKESFEANKKGYSDFIDLLKKKPHITIKQKFAIEFKKVNELVENKFLIVSSEYLKYVNELIG